MSKINCSKCGEMTTIISNTEEFKYQCSSCSNVYVPEGKDTIIMFKNIKDIPIGHEVLNNNIAKNVVNPIEKGKVCDNCNKINTTRYAVQMMPNESIKNYQCIICKYRSQL
jgi:DNA-directed RNA polymerase subunit M/transcription elongation factor TFIIS